MARKKAEEHENMERWMVSYADFMTLLFATFVVLYALSQTDISSFFELQESIRSSFSTGVTEGSDSFFDDSDSMVGSYDADSLLMMEYLNQKYEETAFEDLKNEIESMKKEDKDLENVEVEINENGLTIKFTESEMLFKSGSAQIKPEGYKILKKVGALVREKFKVHLIRVEGHTDNVPIRTKQFPSNWELSSARASSVVRYYIQTFDFQPVLFSAAGLAEYRPAADNMTEAGRRQNRRVELTILRNKYKKVEMNNAEVHTQRAWEIEHMKLKKSDVKQKVNFNHLNKPITEDIIDIVPKQQDMIFTNTSSTSKKEGADLEEIQRHNRKLFSGGK